MPWLRPVVLAGIGITTLGCSGDGPSPERVDSAAPLVVTAATDAGLALADGDARCVVQNLDSDSAETIVAGEEEPWPEEVTDAIAAAIVDCVGAEVLARSALEPITVGADVDAVDCAVDRIDADLLVALISADLGPGVADRGVESVVVEAVSFCLDPVELLDRGS